MLDPVAVVDVPVEDEDPAQPVHRYGVLGGDPNIVEQAETMRLILNRKYS